LIREEHALEPFKVRFDSMEWQHALPGARFKSFHEGEKQLRLLELTSEFVEPEWCEKGHVGIVLKGELEIDFSGHVVRYPEGSGILIPSGVTSAHKARAISSTALCVFGRRSLASVGRTNQRALRRMMNRYMRRNALRLLTPYKTQCPILWPTG